MNNYVQYHNTEQRGYSCEDLDVLRVYTRRPVDRLPGQRLWLISGEGRPRRYYLCMVFRVDEVGLADDPARGNYVRGTEGRMFRPPIPFDELPWFPDFLKSQQNFSLGLRQVEPQYVQALETLVAES